MKSKRISSKTNKRQRSGEEYIAVLRKWRQKCGKKATYERLTKAFWEMGNVALADEVTKVLLQSEPDSSEGEDDAPQKTG